MSFLIFLHELKAAHSKEIRYDVFGCLVVVGVETAPFTTKGRTPKLNQVLTSLLSKETRIFLVASYTSFDSTVKFYNWYPLLKSI